MSKADMFFNSDQDSNFGVRPEGHQPASVFQSHGEEPRFSGTKRDINAKVIALSRIVAKQQVRKHFDEQELQELAHSLRTVGQKTPILVYWSDEESIYVIIAGERRYRAAQMAGLTELSCQIHPHKPDEAELVELQYVENAIRSDLNPIEEAHSYRLLQELKGYSAHQLAERIGKNQSTISRSLSLLKLPEHIQQQVASGGVPVTVAREIAKLDSPGEQDAMLGRYQAGELNRDGVQAATSSASSSKATARQSSKQTKKWNQGGVSIAVSYGRGVTLSDLADALEERARLLRADGRAKKAA
jgi:ParB family chromosome partitioning protein